MITKKTPKNPKKYICVKCDFLTSNKRTMIDTYQPVNIKNGKMITMIIKKTPKIPRVKMKIYRDHIFVFSAIRVINI